MEYSLYDPELNIRRIISGVSIVGRRDYWDMARKICNNGLTIIDPAYISRNHVRIDLTLDRPFALNLSNVNPALINRQFMPSEGLGQCLSHGDEIQMGPWKVIFEAYNDQDTLVLN
jgi:hypothetical protein